MASLKALGVSAPAKRTRGTVLQPIQTPSGSCESKAAATCGPPLTWPQAAQAMLLRCFQTSFCRPHRCCCRATAGSHILRWRQMVQRGGPWPAEPACKPASCLPHSLLAQCMCPCSASCSLAQQLRSNCVTPCPTQPRGQQPRRRHQHQHQQRQERRRQRCRHGCTLIRVTHSTQRSLA